MARGRWMGMGLGVLLVAVTTRADIWLFPSEARTPRRTEAHDRTAAVPIGAEADDDQSSSGETLWEDLLEGNRRFQDDAPETRDWVRERRKLLKGQHPRAIILSCSDSRVPPEFIFDQSLGDLFVVRTAGHVLSREVLASIEYAAEHLHSKLLIVMGHEKCGAVTAAAADLGDAETGNMQAMIDDIRPALEPLLDRYQGEELIKRGVEAHVQRTAAEVLRHSPILYHLAKQGNLTVIRAVYSLKSGAVERLR